MRMRDTRKSTSMPGQKPRGREMVDITGMTARQFRVEEDALGASRFRLIICGVRKPSTLCAKGAQSGTKERATVQQ
jgi:hypothetical protein